MAEGVVSSKGLDAHLKVARGDFRLDVALVIPPGKTVALLGPNGAGKSTTVSALAGLLPLDAGHINLAGIVLDDPKRGLFVAPEARNLGVVFQDYLLFPHLTVIDNIAFGLRSRRVDKRTALARAAEWVERMGLTGLGHKPPGDLSGGQAQRVALARALAIEPAMLLLDEPLSALDVTTRVQLRRSLAEHLEAFGGPRLLITHDPTEAFLLADEIHVIEEGSVTQVGSPDDIRLRPKTQYVADLAGSNLIVGIAQHGVVDTGQHLIQIADHKVTGEVLATIRPSAIAVHNHEPEGSPRNAWKTKIELIEHLGERTRLRTGPPVALTVEITTDATRALRLQEGMDVWISIKATEVTVESNQTESGYSGAPGEEKSETGV